tara:strand:+ start:499 stop:726 length:228 start_codon:yes stop_codon:yes gene_type:complete
MPRKKQVEILEVHDQPDLVRDTSSNAIININESAYQARLAQIEKSKLDAQQSEKINSLEKDVEEIKNLLKQLVSK